MRVRVGIVDSGINPDHPHVGQVIGGVLSRVRSPRSKFGDAPLISQVHEIRGASPNFPEFLPVPAHVACTGTLLRC